MMEKITEFLDELSDLIKKNNKLNDDVKRLRKENEKFKRSLERVWTSDGKNTIAKASVEIETSDPTVNSSRFLGTLSKHRFVTNSNFIKVKFRNKKNESYVLIVDVDHNKIHTNMSDYSMKYDGTLTQETPIR
jgi:hypothetical protein